MKILVTGICGFVVSALSSALLDAEPGVEIAGLDNLSRRQVIERNLFGTVNILDEIARHAEEHPGWPELSGAA